MITATSTARQLPAQARWQQELADAIVSPAALAAELGLDPAVTAGAEGAMQGFAMRVPRSFAARMRRGDPNDPLLKQVLPVKAETREAPLYTADPLGERSAARAPCLLQKYHGRALLIATAACAVHCRYCFRREYPYSAAAGDRRFGAALAELAGDASITELILSGGDPLSLADSRLSALTDALAAIPHLKRLRIHTRLPIVVPARVDAGLIAWLEHLPWRVTVVLHANHAQELDAEVDAACARLAATGATLLNQSVLLRGVNDDPQVLMALSERLFAAGVLPYYLHLLDRVRGTAHFEVSEERARELLGYLAAHLSGYLVPRLVREVHGAPAKLTLPPIF